MKTITLTCPECQAPFKKQVKHFNEAFRNDPERKLFCSKKCSHNHKGDSVSCQCKNCGDQFVKLRSQIKKTKNHFCSKSCSASFNNTHKTKGTRRSKLEVWLESKLTELYPNLGIEFNSKSAIDSELDIYIPSLKVGFELNGIFHYEPIYGDEKLGKIQNNDQRKFAACHEAGISLCVIDTSSQKYFKESSSKKFLDIITKLVNLELSKTDRVEVL